MDPWRSPPPNSRRSTVLNLASGSTPLELLGGLGDPLVLLSTQDEAEQLCEVEKLLAVWVESVTLSV